MSLTVRVITPDKTVWDAEAQEVILPSMTGQLGILSGHAPLLTALEAGVMRVRPGKDWQAIALTGGFAEVENDEVKILVNGADLGSDIDKNTAETEFNQAKERLAKADGGQDNSSEKILATKAFKVARARFQASGGNVQL